jgi:hypothetical protein
LSTQKEPIYYCTLTTFLICVTYPEFKAHWQIAGGAERANYGLSLTEPGDFIGIPRPDATTDTLAQDAYAFERIITFDNGPGNKVTTSQIDLYRSQGGSVTG